MAKIETIKIGEVSYEISDKELAAVNVKAIVGNHAVAGETPVDATGLCKDVDYLKDRLYWKADKGNVELSAKTLTKADETASSLNLCSDGKIAIKSASVSMESPSIVIPVEISKSGKLTIAGVDSPYMVDETTTKSDILSKIQAGATISFVLEKNNYTTNTELYEALPVNSNLLGTLPLADLFFMEARIEALEAKVEDLLPKE